MSALEMTCPLCGGTIKEGLANLPVELEAGILYIKRIPADVRNQCEGAFIPDNAAADIEKIVARAKRDKVEIEVVFYEGAA